MQTLYPRPFFTTTYLIIQVAIIIPAIIFWTTLGFNSTPSQICWYSFYTVQLGAVLIDPVFCSLTRTEDRDGVKVRVKRPFVGLRCCETRVPDDVEDGDMTHEQAFLRI